MLEKKASETVARDALSTYCSRVFVFMLMLVVMDGCTAPEPATTEELPPLHESVRVEDESDAPSVSDGVPSAEPQTTAGAEAVSDPGQAEAASEWLSDGVVADATVQDATHDDSAAKALTQQGEDSGDTPPDDAVLEDSEGEGGAFSPLLGGLDVSGSLSSRVRYRSGNGDKDGDFYSVLSVQVNDPGKDAYSGYFLGRVADDFLGGTSSDNSFFSLNDTWAGSWNFRLYEAYVDANDIDGLEKLRIGRQSLYDTPEYLSFDGAMVITEADGNGTQWGTYAGLPFRAYESERSDGRLAGTWIETQPWRGGRVRLDYLYLKDDLDGGDEQNNFWALSFWQTFERLLRLRGSYSFVEGNSRDAEVAATYYDPEIDLTVQAQYKELLTTQRLLATEIDPLYETLIQYEPYRQARLIVAKGLGEHWLLEGGTDIRRLSNSSDEGQYNHEFERYYLTTIASDLVAEDLDLSLTGELWSADQQSNYATWGFDATKELNERVRMSGGMVYAKWKDDFLLNEEHEDARTYYTRLRYKSSETMTWAFGYAYEDNKIDDFQTVTARMTWRF